MLHVWPCNLTGDGLEKLVTRWRYQFAAESFDWPIVLEMKAGGPAKCSYRDLQIVQRMQMRLKK